MLNRKPLIIAAVAAATVGVTTLSSQAYANNDALLGAIVGAGCRRRDWPQRSRP
jgi:hypothetical protein